MAAIIRNNISKQVCITLLVQKSRKGTTTYSRTVPSYWVNKKAVWFMRCSDCCLKSSTVPQYGSGLTFYISTNKFYPILDHDLVN